MSLQAPPAPSSSVTPLAEIRRRDRLGVDVTLRLWPDVEDGINDGWVVHLVEALVGDQTAGYLKVSYVPGVEATRRFPDALRWAAAQKGRYRALRDLPMDESEWDREQRLVALSATDPWHVSEEEADEREVASDARLHELWATRRGEVEARHSGDYDAFLRFHEDRPLVDYIRVFDGLHPERLYVAGRRARETVDVLDWRRRGIGTLLYETGALWMSAWGMSLHASGLQSEEARRAWASLDRRGLVRATGERDGRGEGRRVLCAEALRRDAPGRHEDLAALALAT